MGGGGGGSRCSVKDSKEFLSCFRSSVFLLFIFCLSVCCCFVVVAVVVLFVCCCVVLFLCCCFRVFFRAAWRFAQIFSLDVTLMVSAYTTVVTVC